ncbi:pyruvate, phosphate dikinase [Phycicoccus endophyticus]|uniref:Pyruvate, phosphate dikinase n=1 Tax=Phycicoccus endophyticus TaxID=1690220 RepID=A0A7G9R395_9MICO|nr:pyruvate, phosphate dikinase [Phycicoccus endophyticus]NHI19814.1 pyruvate, phosphate dikinase [Phycicoccus endophyticus]QNN50070.1 pyruvate, phosphate dikinase [Phycicoccus endophyticus]GGL28387.1 pyruvate, phosphate dikinase [Phycicoccus endophyticus]
MAPFVHEFESGSKEQKDLLGGKGANLAEMTRLGIPVPPGFTITTDACRHYLAHGEAPEGLWGEVEAHVATLEQRMGRRLGDPGDPLLVSVRSGAKFSMPGMMETVLNVGLGDAAVEGLAHQTGDPRFAWDSYRRLLQMYGKTVLGLDGDLFEDAIDAAKRARGVTADVDLDVDDLRGLAARFQEVILRESGAPFPQEPLEQLRAAVVAVFDSWNSDRAALYRRRERIPADLGTAVNIQAMAFGNRGADSGSGVAFTRDPATGERGTYGDYLPDAQGEDVVAGVRNTLTLADLERIDPASYRELLEIMARLEEHYRDMCDIEFTIERGRLWMLQTRVGKRTAEAAFRIATDLLEEGVITEEEALSRVTGEQLAQLMFPHFVHGGGAEAVATGMAASPGAAVGQAVFDSDTAVRMTQEGTPVILVRRETTPDDLHGMVAARGILTSRGGKTSHAAVVARGMGRTCVCGAEALDVDTRAGCLTLPDGTVVRQGETISIDGSTGEVFRGEVDVAPSPVVRYFEGEVDPQDAPPVVRAVHRMMEVADRRRRLRVRANADNAADAARAARFGAEGIGLARTEHMFLGERRAMVERLILAEGDEERQVVFDELLPLQRRDFVELFEAMGGRPVTVRLLDPPLHEFLPDLTELSVRVAIEDERGEHSERDTALLRAVLRLHEQNPMLGLRGVRLGLAIPGLFAMQARAVLEAAALVVEAGGQARPEIMVPLVGDVRELRAIREEIDAAAHEVRVAHAVHLDHLVGTMIELPRAALTAGEIAQTADFFSFGTNDLTQTTWGFSRDDVESSFFSRYLEKGIFGVSPFETIDRTGVGRLVQIAAWEGRQTRGDLKLGVCGEHGGDPESIGFFDESGLDYVSCSPFRVPVARLEAGRCAVGG